jgi:hypothetical protein
MARPLIKHAITAVLASTALMGFTRAACGATPSWLLDLAAAPANEVPPDMPAVQLLDEVELVVTSDGKMRKHLRGAVRILRQDGLARAGVTAPVDPWHAVKDMHAWLVPATGKQVELRFKDAIETAALAGDGEMVSDYRMKTLGFPAAAPGAVVGYEYVVEQSPLEMSDTFAFQDSIPVREARYTLKLPSGWSMSPAWLNHAAVMPVGAAGSGQWQWSLGDIPAIVTEDAMPAWTSVSAQLFVAFSPPGKTPQLGTWAGIGSWYSELSKDRRAASDAMRAKVAQLVAGKASQLEKIRALAEFAQRDVRYVSIQLGIGGYRPHAAAEVFKHLYGDCKDKATLLGVMLGEIGIESMPVLVNTERTHVRTDTPPSLQFNHVILAIRLPRDLEHGSLLATAQAGEERWLYFDPTDELTPLGRLRGQLQGSVGLLVLSDGSRLVTLPQLAPQQNGISRTARLVLGEQGTLSGEIRERITGQEALMQRGFLRASTRASDATKIIEARLAESLSSFQLGNAVSRNTEVSELPLERDYRISAASYARRAGDLLMVRPRVLGVHAVTLANQDKSRVHDLVLSEPRLHQDETLIELPPGYVVDSLPPPVEMDAGFAIYRSRTEVTGSQLKYTRSYEVRDLMVPAAKVVDFIRLHREIARDERAVVVLRKAGS